MIPPSADYPWYTQEYAGESWMAANANAMLIQQYREEGRVFDQILGRTAYAYQKELKMPVELPEGVEPIEDDDAPATPEELGDPAKFTWEDEDES